MTTNRMLQFVGTEKSMPKKRKATDRKQDFDEISVSYTHLTLPTN